MGLYLASCAFSFIVFWFFFGIYLTPIFSFGDVAILTIYEYRYTILDILFFNVLYSVMQILGKGSIIGTNSLFHRRYLILINLSLLPRLWSLFELF